MAERRMMAKSVIETDQFMDMPMSTQNLYFHLLLRGDDDGFVKNPKAIRRLLGCSDDDIKMLIAKQYVILFDSGVIAIKHWKIHNWIRKDAYRPTTCEEEFKHLLSDKKNGYIYTDTVAEPLQDCNDTVVEPLQDCNTRIGKDRIGKDRIGKDRIGKDSIGKDSIGKDNILTTTTTTTIDNDRSGSSRDENVFKFWDNNISPLTEHIAEKLRMLVEECGETFVLAAERAAVEHNARNYAYVNATAQRMLRGESDPRKGDDSLEAAFEELYGKGKK